MKLVEYGGCVEFIIEAPTEDAKRTGPTKLEVAGAGMFGGGECRVWCRLVTPVQPMSDPTQGTFVDEHAFMLTREQVAELVKTLERCLETEPRTSEVPDVPKVPPKENA